MKLASFGEGTGAPVEVTLAEGGGRSGHENKEVMNAAAIFAVDS